MKIKNEKAAVYWLHNVENKLRRWTAEYEERRRNLRQAHYDPNQPRVPAGQVDGGQWTYGGGGSASQGPQPASHFATSGPESDPQPKQPARMDADVAIKKLRAQLDPKFPYGRGECAAHVRVAIEAATGEQLPRPASRAAKDYGPGLEQIGFNPVAVVAAEQGYPPKNYIPVKGDVAVVQPTSKNPAGHMAMYEKTQTIVQGQKSILHEVWISDFEQPRGFWAGSRYRAEQPAYIIYRQDRE